MKRTPVAQLAWREVQYRDRVVEAYAHTIAHMMGEIADLTDLADAKRLIEEQLTPAIEARDRAEAQYREIEKAEEGQKEDAPDGINSQLSN
jgi:hypothetical protein